MDAKRIEEISAMSKTELARRIQAEKTARGITSWYAHPMHTWNKDELINALIDFESESDRERQTER